MTLLNLDPSIFATEQAENVQTQQLAYIQTGDTGSILLSLSM